MDDEGGFGDWEEEETAAEEAPPEEEIEYDEDGYPIEKPPPAPAGEEGEGGDGFDFGDIPEGEGEPEEPQGPPEPKLRWSKWERPKSHIYDYNYGYFNNYYSGMVDRISEKNAGKQISFDRPLAESWAERSSRMYRQMNEAKRSTHYVDRNEELIRRIRAGNDSFFAHRHELSAREVGYNKH